MAWQHFLRFFRMSVITSDNFPFQENPGLIQTITLSDGTGALRIWYFLVFKVATVKILNI